MTRICIASIYTQEIQELAKITIKNKQEYCDKNGYHGAFIKHTDREYRAIDGINLVESLLKSNKFDYVGWFDCDLLFTNYNKKLEDLLDEEHSFFTSTDFTKEYNLGTYIVRNSQEGLDFIEYIKDQTVKLSHLNKIKLGEVQTAMIFNKSNPIYKTVKVLPQKSINAYTYTDKEVRDFTGDLLDVLETFGNWEYGDLLVHFPGFIPGFYDRLLKHIRNYSNKVIK